MPKTLYQMSELVVEFINQQTDEDKIMSKNTLLFLLVESVIADMHKDPNWRVKKDLQAESTSKLIQNLSV